MRERRLLWALVVCTIIASAFCEEEVDRPKRQGCGCTSFCNCQPSFTSSFSANFRIPIYRPQCSCQQQPQCSNQCSYTQMNRDCSSTCQKACVPACNKFSTTPGICSMQCNNICSGTCSSARQTAATQPPIQFMPNPQAQQVSANPGCQSACQNKCQTACESKVSSSIQPSICTQTCSNACQFSCSQTAMTATMAPAVTTTSTTPQPVIQIALDIRDPYYGTNCQERCDQNCLSMCVSMGNRGADCQPACATTCQDSCTTSYATGQSTGCVTQCAKGCEAGCPPDDVHVCSPSCAAACEQQCYKVALGLIDEKPKTTVQAPPVQQQPQQNCPSSCQPACEPVCVQAAYQAPAPTLLPAQNCPTQCQPACQPTCIQQVTTTTTQAAPQCIQVCQPACEPTCVQKYTISVVQPQAQCPAQCQPACEQQCVQRIQSCPTQCQPACEQQCVQQVQTPVYLTAAQPQAQQQACPAPCQPACEQQCIQSQQPVTVQVIAPAQSKVQVTSATVASTASTSCPQQCQPACEQQCVQGVQVSASPAAANPANPQLTEPVADDPNASPQLPPNPTELTTENPALTTNIPLNPVPTLPPAPPLPSTESSAPPLNPEGPVLAAGIGDPNSLAEAPEIQGQAQESAATHIFEAGPIFMSPALDGPENLQTTAAPKIGQNLMLNSETVQVAKYEAVTETATQNPLFTATFTKPYQDLVASLTKKLRLLFHPPPANPNAKIVFKTTTVGPSSVIRLPADQEIPEDSMDLFNDDGAPNYSENSTVLEVTTPASANATGNATLNPTNLSPVSTVADNITLLNSITLVPEVSTSNPKSLELSISNATVSSTGNSAPSTPPISGSSMTNHTQVKDLATSAPLAGVLEAAAALETTAATPQAIPLGGALITPGPTLPENSTLPPTPEETTEKQLFTTTTPIPSTARTRPWPIIFAYVPSIQPENRPNTLSQLQTSLANGLNMMQHPESSILRPPGLLPAPTKILKPPAPLATSTPFSFWDYLQKARPGLQLSQLSQQSPNSAVLVSSPSQSAVNLPLNDQVLPPKHLINSNNPPASLAPLAPLMQTQTNGANQTPGALPPTVHSISIGVSNQQLQCAQPCLPTCTPDCLIGLQTAQQNSVQQQATAATTCPCLDTCEKGCMQTQSNQEQCHTLCVEVCAEECGKITISIPTQTQAPSGVANNQIQSPDFQSPQCMPACEYSCNMQCVERLPQDHCGNICRGTCAPACRGVCEQSCSNTVLQPLMELSGSVTSHPATPSSAAPVFSRIQPTELARETLHDRHENQHVLFEAGASQECAPKCQADCENLCPTVTPQCQTGCQNSCAQLCGKAPTPVAALVTATVSYNCQVPCDVQCTQNCAGQEPACATSCAGQCEAACPTVTCEDACETVCQGQCTFSGQDSRACGPACKQSCRALCSKRRVKRDEIKP
ncbi:unnamed protein product, partial [Mesorhabditis spiculigera]